MNPNIKHSMRLLLLSLILSACDNQMPATNCLSEASYKTVSQSIIDAVEKKTSDEKYTNTGEFIFDKAKIRALLDQLQITVESVRTTQADPNSTKKFCSAVLKVTIPTNMLADADQAKKLENKPNISQDSRTLDIENNINVFTKKDFEYNVQPTDDGKELYIESEKTIWVELLHDITRSALLKPILEVQQAVQAQKNAQEKQVIETLKQEAEASKLEVEKLSALQEKQEADRLKRELIVKQSVISSAETATSTHQEQTKANHECENANKTIFSCLTGKGKLIEVCDSGQTIDYSFGKSKTKPEIVVHAPRDKASTTQWQGIGRYMSFSVEIPNGNTTYSVYWSVDRNSDQHPIEAGVNVEVNKKLTATVNCADENSIVQNIEGINLRPTE